MGGRDNKQVALLAAIMGSFVAGLDATAVNVALPAIRADLGGGLAGQQWVSNAYLLTLGSLILVGGSLGDIFGERRIFSLGVAGFGVVSVLCAAAPTIEFLIAGRALQGAFVSGPYFGHPASRYFTVGKLSAMGCCSTTTPARG